MSHQPRKRFGQNFLRDERVIHNIVAAISPRQDEHLVEIGPGQGALTRRLLAECEQLDVVELDRDLVEYLRQQFAAESRLGIHAGDALRFDFSSLRHGKPLRVVGNLPYNISTPLLFHLFEYSADIQDMHFMLQKEVVDRLCAEPGNKDYGRLGIMAQYYCTTEPLLDVPPESFHPQPKIMSAVVRLVPHPNRPVDIEPETLGRIVTAAFSQRRKTLRNALSGLLNAEDITQAGINPANRAETLGLEDFAALGRIFLAKQKQSF
jgi:16S rRNA (adenine1518-N6/adenine1519-N6)-dimethyltransferase